MSGHLLSLHFIELFNSQGLFDQGYKMKAYFFLFIMVFILSLGCFFIQKQVDLKAPKIRQESLLYLPSGRHLKPLTLGYNHLIADFFWIQAVGYFGQHYLTDQNYPWLYHILDIITTLDPLFQYAYEFGGLLLSIGEGNYHQSNILLKKGIHYFPEYWRLYFYIGFNHFFYLNDPSTAAPYIQKAAMLPGHPPYLPNLAASLYVASHKPELGIEFLLQIYQATGDEMLREQIEQKITELSHGKLPKRLQKYL